VVKRFAGAESLIEVLHSPRSESGQVALGRALLLTCGLIVGSTIWSLGVTRPELPVLAATSAVMLGVVALSPFLPWSSGPSWLPLLFPVSVMAALVCIGLADDGAVSAYTGLIVLCFVYVGLTQRPGTSLLLIPVAAGAWTADQDSWSAATGIRLSIGVIIWLLVGELLSYRSGRVAMDRLILSEHARTDALTGLLNRRALDDRLAEARDGDAIVMCDLDHFKDLNDRDGHAAGDRVLAEFGALLTAALRGQDAAGRYGGEEFVLILAETSPEAALDVLLRMRAAWFSAQPGLTFSSGIAAVADSTPSAVALAAADEALYASKQAGRNCDHISYQQIVRGN
jgi:diguanylate cyclase (GGDEF)-like protein